MSYLLWAALRLGACGAEPPCRPGFTRAEDGHCYPPPADPEPPSATDVLESLGPCIPLKPSDDVDLLTGCLALPGGDPGCPGDTFDALDTAWERGADCSLNGSKTTWTCD